MKKILLVCCLVASIVLSPLTADARNNVDLDNARITMRSKVEKSVKANTADINLGVRVQSSSLQNAQRDVNNSVKGIVDALHENGVAKDDVQTGRYSIQNFNRGDQDKNVVYIVENNLILKVRDIDKLGKLLDVAIDNGANQIYGIHFLYEGADRIQEELLKQAVVNARKQANIILGADGRSAGRLLNLEVYGTQSKMSEDNYGANVTARYNSAGAGSQVFTGDVLLSAEVNISFEIE